MHASRQAGAAGRAAAAQARAPPPRCRHKAGAGRTGDRPVLSRLSAAHFPAGSGAARRGRRRRALGKPRTTAMHQRPEPRCVHGPAQRQPQGSCTAAPKHAPAPDPNRPSRRREEREEERCGKQVLPPPRDSRGSQTHIRYPRPAANRYAMPQPSPDQTQLTMGCKQKEPEGLDRAGRRRERVKQREKSESGSSGVGAALRRRHAAAARHPSGRRA